MVTSCVLLGRVGKPGAILLGQNGPAGPSNSGPYDLAREGPDHGRAMVGTLEAGDCVTVWLEKSPWFLLLVGLCFPPIGIHVVSSLLAWHAIC